MDIYPGFAACDLSFISLTKIIPHATVLLPDEGQAVFLIKPQFEVGPNKITKRGVVKDSKAHVMVISNVIECLKSNGFGIYGLDFSPITGGKGNVEYLVYVVKGLPCKGIQDIAKVVKFAHIQHARNSFYSISL